MKCDLKKLVNVDATMELEWHGEDTKVLVKGEGEKTEVKKGDTLKVSVAQAQELLRYSFLWTLVGEEPANHPFDNIAKVTAIKNAAAESKRLEKAKNKKDGDDENDDEDDDLENLKPEEMKKPQIVAVLKKLGVTFNDRTGVDKLAGLLKETLNELAAEAKNKKDGDDEKVPEVTEDATSNAKS